MTFDILWDYVNHNRGDREMWMFVFVISHCKVTGVVTAQYTNYKIVVIMSLAYELRDQTKIYLIGDDANQIIGSKLTSSVKGFIL